ncbi:MAG: S9 family peptidase [Bacteroidales bacterium]|nr:S9 family peptidase [Bacteroidota bacterium]MBL6949842.1 S9 family peptidase [Bacteroidales bacterium]
MKQSYKFAFTLLLIAALPAFHVSFGQSVFTAKDLLGLERCRVHQLSPDGTELIYSVSTPRGANEKPGSAHTKYLRMKLVNKESSPLFEKDMKVSSPRYSPDGSFIAFTHKKEKDPSQVWVMPAAGGDTIQLTHAKNGVTYFRWQPDGQGLAYLSTTPRSATELELKKRGYDFIYYEEDLRNNQLFIIRFDTEFQPGTQQQMLKDTHVWDFEFSPDGQWLAFSSSEKNLIDHRYMFRKMKILDMSSGNVVKEVGNEGKLGNYAFNREGSHLAFTSALNMNDHAVSQVFTYSMKDETIRNHTPANFKGHISWVGWKNDNELLCYSGEGVYPKLSSIFIENDKRSVMLDARTSGIIFGIPLFTTDCQQFVFTGNTPNDPSNIYTWNSSGDLYKVTDLNPQLSNKFFGEQEVIRYKARDGMEIEGLLIKPVGYDSTRKYPLILYVHGGPEWHHSNGWLSRYSTPGQVMSGKGYLVAYLNYRASTGYGVDFGMEGFMDPAGKEFDDLADGIDYLVVAKGADKERVGMAGGSYGGYASAWFATYYTRYVKAVCVFVGISNLISKRGTTDIAYEEFFVHSGKSLEEQWQMNLERSPVYWAHQSKTATLIYGGAADSRVHPSQSLELHRRMKMNSHPAVRLVQYPGEGHGNRKQPGRIDVLYRQIDWLDWYVKDLKPLEGPMPPLDISDKYGLDWEL